ncbi:MAG: hypothetical protein PHW56_10020, partial [Methanosarcinaceae archaeon]|nr:hypothetical protein [Methanosarcinaceae archaeon]
MSDLDTFTLIWYESVLKYFHLKQMHTSPTLFFEKEWEFQYSRRNFVDSKHFKTANLNEGPTTVKNRKNIFGEIFRKFFIRFPGRISEIIW